MKRCVVFLAGLMILGAAAPVCAEGISEKMFARTTESGMHYLCGGIGTDERAVLEQLGRGYSLKLVTSVMSGEYLTEANILIVDSTGKTVFSASADAPWLYVDLPAGTYSVTASAPGKTLEKRITLGAAGQKELQLVWQ